MLQQALWCNERLCNPLWMLINAKIKGFDMPLRKKVCRCLQNPICANKKNNNQFHLFFFHYSIYCYSVSSRMPYRNVLASTFEMIVAQKNLCMVRLFSKTLSVEYLKQLSHWSFKSAQIVLQPTISTIFKQVKRQMSHGKYISAWKAVLFNNFYFDRPHQS